MQLISKNLGTVKVVSCKRDLVLTLDICGLNAVVETKLTRQMICHATPSEKMLESLWKNFV